MGAKSKAVMGGVDALGNKIGALGDYLKEFDPKTYYHYSPNPNIKKFDPKTKDDSFGIEANTGEKFKGRGATYFTSDPKYANEIGEAIEENEYAVEAFPTIYPVKIKTKDIFDFTNEKQMEKLIDNLKSVFSKKGYEAPPYSSQPYWVEYAREIEKGNYDYLEDPDVRKVLKKLGFRGYKTSEPGTVGLFYSDKGDVRSVFAKFDPSKSGKGNILASVPAGALGALGAMDGESSN